MTLDQALNAAATYQGIAQNTSDHLGGESAARKRPARFEGPLKDIGFLVVKTLGERSGHPRRARERQELLHR